MILLIFGTQDKSFHRVLVEVERLIDKKVIKDKVIAQIGYTEYKSDKIETYDFMDKKKLEELEQKADYIICHAGVGTIMENLTYNKKLIVIPRLKKYKEHTNDHQLQILATFSSQGYVLACNEIGELETCVKKIKKFKPHKIENRDNSRMINIIENFMNELGG